GFAIGRGAEGTEVARCDPVVGKPAARERDVRLELCVALLPRLRARRQQPEFLQLAGEAPVDPGALAELLQVEFGLLGRQARSPAPLAIARGGRRKLLADHAQREKLVALQPQNRLQPLEVLFAEEPVAALRAPRGEQALVL